MTGTFACIRAAISGAIGGSFGGGLIFPWSSLQGGAFPLPSGLFFGGTAGAPGAGGGAGAFLASVSPCACAGGAVLDGAPASFSATTAAVVSAATVGVGVPPRMCIAAIASGLTASVQSWPLPGACEMAVCSTIWRSLLSTVGSTSGVASQLSVAMLRFAASRIFW